MLDVRYNRIIALHQTHILIFQFGHYVWRRLFEGEVLSILLKQECCRSNCLKVKQCNVFIHDLKKRDCRETILNGSEKSCDVFISIN